MLNYDQMLIDIRRAQQYLKSVPDGVEAFELSGRLEVVTELIKQVKESGRLKYGEYLNESMANKCQVCTGEGSHPGCTMCLGEQRKIALIDRSLADAIRAENDIYRKQWVNAEIPDGRRLQITGYFVDKCLEKINELINRVNGDVGIPYPSKPIEDEGFNFSDADKEKMAKLFEKTDAKAPPDLICTRCGHKYFFEQVSGNICPKCGAQVQRILSYFKIILETCTKMGVYYS